MATITTPVKGFNGSTAGVLFVDGVGETVDEGAIAYFNRHGYKVGSRAAKAADKEPGEEPEKAFSQLNKAELTALAEAEEIDISEASTNAEIRATITAARESK